MSGLNHVQLIGNLGRDPDMRYTKAGTPVATLSIATTTVYKNKDGKKVDDTEWHRVSVWDKQAENCEKYLKKGSKVYVSGRLKTTRYEDDNGVTKYSTDVVARQVLFLDSKGSGARPHPADLEDGSSADLPPHDLETGEVHGDVPF